MESCCRSNVQHRYGDPGRIWEVATLPRRSSCVDPDLHKSTLCFELLSQQGDLIGRSIGSGYSSIRGSNSGKGLLLDLGIGRVHRTPLQVGYYCVSNNSEEGSNRGTKCPPLKSLACLLLGIISVCFFARNLYIYGDPTKWLG